MRPGSMFAIIAAVLLAAADFAAADMVVASGRTRMHARPGEMARVVKVLRRGQKARIVRVRGRWYKVRVGRRSGWVTRTTVRRLGVHKHKRVRRWGRRSSKRYGSWRDQSMVPRKDPALPASLEVTIDRARAFSRPSARSAPAFAVSRGARVRVLAVSRRRRWYLVQTDDSAPGWIAAAAVAPIGTGRATTRALPSPSVSRRAHTPEPEPAPAPLARVDGLRLSVGMGLHSLATRFRSDGSAGLGNYDLSTNAAQLVARAGVRRSLGKLTLGAFVQYNGAYAAPGLHYQPSAGGEGDVSLTAHGVDARAAVGARLARAAGGVRVYAVAGYRYQVTLTGDLDNIARLPNESLRAGLVGGRIELPRVADGTAIAAAAYTLVGARLGQTEGLMDGTSSDVTGMSAQVTVSKQLSPAWLLVANYLYDKLEVSFSGASSRQPDVTRATRADRGHTIVVGIGRRM